MLLHTIPLLAASKNCTSFLGLVEQKHPKGTLGYEMIKKAAHLSEELFEGETRASGEPYITHPFAVAIIVLFYLGITDWEYVVAAILHDNREHDRKKWNKEFVVYHFGFFIHLLLDCLTEDDEWRGMKKGCDVEYLTRWEKIPIYELRLRLICIKLADRLHNLLTLDAMLNDHAKVERKIEETQEFYLPLAHKYGILVLELEAAIHEVIEAMR